MEACAKAQSPTGSVLRTLYGKTQIDSRTKRYRVAPQPVSPELPGCGGLVPLGNPAEQPLPLNSVGSGCRSALQPNRTIMAVPQVEAGGECSVKEQASAWGGYGLTKGVCSA